MEKLVSLNVLLIEDNPSDALLLTTALKADRLTTFVVTQVERIEAGLRFLKDKAFDVVITDLGLPDSAGLDTFKRLHTQYPEMPIVVISGNEDEQQAIDAVREGAQDYIVKSLSGFESIARAIRYAVERARVQSQLAASESRFVSLFQSNPIPVGITRKSDYRIVDVNEAWTKLTGYTREEAIGHTTIELGLAKPETLQEIRKILDEHGEIRYFEIPLYTRVGNERRVMVSSEPIELGGESYFLNNLLDITEQKLVEDALKESEKRFSTAFFTNPVAQSILSVTNGQVLEVNDATCRLFDYSREEIIGADPEKFNLWANPAEQATILEVLQKTGHVLPTEITIRRKSGDIRTILFAVEPITWKGTPCLITSSIDINERKQAEDALKRNEKVLRLFVEHTPAAIAMFDREMRYIVASRRFLEDFRLPPQDLTGRSHYEVFPEISERIKEIHRRCLAGAVEKHDNTPFLRTDGRLDWVRWEMHPWYEDDENKTIGGVILFSEVITDRVLTEQSLKESEERLQLVLEGSQLGYWDWNIATGEVHRNARWGEMLGYTVEEVQSNVKQWTDLHHPEDTAAAQESIQNHLEGKADAHRVEYRMRKKDGSYKWILDQAKIVARGPNGKPLRMCGTHTDITERKLAEHALHESGEIAKAILNAATESVFLMEPDGTVIAANETTASRLGKNVNEIIGRNIYDHLPAQVSEARKARVAKAVSERTPTTFEDERFGAWIENNIYPIIDSTGNVSRVAVYGRDITERKRNEALIYAQRDLARAVGRFHTTEEGFSVFIETILTISGLDGGGIYLFDPDFRNLELIQHVGLSDEFIQDVLYYPPDSPNVKMILAGKPIYYSADHPILQTGRYHKEGLLSLAVIPILHQDRVIGCMNLASHTLKDVPDHARHALETLMPEIGNLAISLRAQEALRERTADLSLLLEAGRAINETLDSRKIYAIIFETVKASLPCDILIVSTFDDQNETITCVHMQNEDGVHDVSGFPSIPLEPPGKGTQSLVIRSGESMLLKDYEAALKTARNTYYFDEKAEILETKPDPEEDRPRSAIMVPLKMGGKVVGVLQIFSFRLNSFTESHLRFVETLAFHASASLSNARLFGELEQRVQQRTAEVQDLYENAPAGYHSLDAKGDFTRINQTELDWLGYKREEVIGHPFSEFITPESLQTFRANFPEFKKRGWVKDLEFEFLRKDGTAFPILVSATAITDEEGLYVMSRSTVLDITERKKAERALRESEEQNRLLFEESPNAVVLLDHGGRISRVNHAFTSITGYPADHLLGKSLVDLSLLPESNAIQLTDTVERSLDQNDNYTTAEFKLQRADGKIRDMDASVYGVNLLGARHYLIAMRDITAAKQTEETLRLANAELERALRLKDEFLANMSHELRTPLNSILGISESLLEQLAGPLNAKQQKYLQTMLESGKHLLEVINDVLDLAKINAGRMELDIVKVSVSAVAHSCLRMVRELAQKKKQEISIAIDPALDVVWADERRIKQMIVNLLGNAVKFTPNGGRIGLDIQGDQQSKLIHFAVWDTGIGIAANDLRLLFQPFVQLDGGLTRGAQGTGLGLTLVSQMARLHGGGVTVKSEPGQGSRFVISIPWVVSGRTGPLGARGPIQAQATPANIHEQSILLVEDTEAVTMLVQDYLESHGYKVHTAKNGLEGIAQAKETHPDLILMDVMMPEMDGFESARRIRSEPGLGTVPIIALTALAMTGDRERCLAAGMNDYLSKPIKMNELLEVVKLYLKAVELYSKDKPEETDE